MLSKKGYVEKHVFNLLFLGFSSASDAPSLGYTVVLSQKTIVGLRHPVAIRIHMSTEI